MAPQRLRDHGVHALGVDLLDLRVDLLVPVLAEHGDAQCHDSTSLLADHLRALPSGRFPNRRGAIRPHPEAARRAFGRAESGSGSAGDRKSTRLNSSHVAISYALVCM